MVGQHSRGGTWWASALEGGILWALSEGVPRDGLVD